MKTAAHRASRSARPQHGVATLVVILVLFFVVSLVAAYTNRNLIFEQRTATNQYRSSQALETAEAGLEWAMSMLNTGLVTDACVASTDVANRPFRERYLSISNSGRITPKGPLDARGAGLSSAACVFNGTGWSCSCPAITDTVAGEGSVTPPTAAGQWPAFRVRFQRVGGTATTAPPLTPKQPSVIKVEVVGCTRADATGLDGCLNFAGQGAAGEGRAVVSSLLALTGGASSPPQAALTARDAVNVDISGGGFSAYNAIAGGSGVTVHSGSSINGFNQLVSLPGSPGGAASTIASDTRFTLAAVTGTGGITTQDRMFAAVFNMRPSAFKDQQAAKEFPSGSATISEIAERHPWRPIWVLGSLAVGADIGTPATPVLMVVNGDLTFTSSSARVFGMVYVRIPSGGANTWVTGGGGQIVGAAVSDNSIQGNGTTAYVFDPEIMNLLRWNTGSFVRVPGSWKDFQ